MRAVLSRVRADLRTRWVSWFALALAIGLGGAVVLTAAAGARRTSTAFPRFLSESHAEDLLINVGPPGDDEQVGFGKLLREFPQVEDAALIAPMLLVPPDRSRHSPYHFAATDRRYGNTVDRPNVVAGRRPRPDHANEALINRAMADERDLDVGDTIDWQVFSPSDGESEEVLDGPGKPVHLRVVGIGVYPNEVVPTAPYDSLPFIYLTPAFFEKYPEKSHVYSFYAIRFRHGQEDAVSFRKGFNRLLREYQVDPQGIPYSLLFERNAQVQRAIEPQAVALGVFAALTGAALLMVVIQVIARRILLDSDEFPALAALGMSRAQLFAGSMVRVGVVALGGAVIAIIGAALASPLMPIGPARLAEPHPGFAFNGAILGLGFVAIVVLVVALAAVPAWRAASIGSSQAREARDAAHDAGSRLTAAISGAGLPATAALGIRNALRPGRGRTRVPVRSAIVVSGVAIALVVASLAFTSNLDRLANTPRLYGWNWTFKAGEGGSPVGREKATVARLREDPDVEAVALGKYGTLGIAGREVPSVGIDPQIGTVIPTLLEGRAPVRNDEIVLGSRTLRRADRSVGESVKVSVVGIGGGCGSDETGTRGSGTGCDRAVTRPMRIVGRAVFPKLAAGSHNPTNLGEGAATTTDILFDSSRPDERHLVLFIRLKPGADVAAARERINRFIAPKSFCDGEPNCVELAQRPGDISNFTRIRSTTLVLAAALVLIALGLLVHVLVSSVRRRGRDLAVLKTLGFMRRQVSAVTAWQATTIAGLALLIGIPVGLALGSIVWRLFADQIGVAPDVSTPVALLLLAIPAVIVLANLIALVPALLAARTHPATVLRSE